MKEQILKYFQSYRTSVSGVHKPTLERHVGNSKSMHNWCKKKVISELELPEPFSSIPSTSRSRASIGKEVDNALISSSISYYTKLFRTVMYIVEDELAFVKLKGLMQLQMKNGVK